MPDISEEKKVVTTYPMRELYESWKEHADELNMSVSQFIIRMVEAGRKQIDLDSVAVESMHEAQRQKSELQSELQHQRQRNRELERQLEFTAHAEIAEFVESNPGAETAEIMQRIADTVPGRVAAHLDAMEGSVLERRDGRYYPLTSEENEDPATPKSDGGGQV